MRFVVGSKAMQATWPITAAWMRWREGGGARPREIARIGARAGTAPGPGVEKEGTGATAWQLGLDALGLVSDWIGEGGETVRTLVRNVIYQSPRLTRLEFLRRDTRISLGLVLAEQEAAAPESTFFLYQGRAYSYAEANRRVDAVVRGLLSIGVRQGMHVGVYMRSRPSALALASAVSRLGAVTVLLRPGGDLESEAALGEVEVLIADPEHGERARALTGRTVYVLGGGGGPRTLPPGLVDMEAIDPNRVAVPEWYDPNPGRSEDVAFILFSGRDQQLHTNRITNRRWALSALGAASAVALTSSDTVYCLSLIHI